MNGNHTGVTPLRLYACYLQWFDAQQLLTLGSFSQAEVEQFLASDAVAFDVNRRMYALTPAAYQQALPLLRQEPTINERELYEQALTETAQRWQDAADDETRSLHQERFRMYFGMWCEFAAAQRAMQQLGAFLDRWHATPIVSDDPVSSQLAQIYRWQVDLRLTKITPINDIEAAVNHLLADADLPLDVRLPAINLLGTVYWFQGNLERAHACFGDLSVVATEYSLHFQGLGWLNQSIILSVLNNHAESLILGRQALACFQQGQNRYREAHILYEIGANLLYLGQWDEATDYLEQSAAIYMQSDVIGDLPHIYWFQAFLYHLVGDDLLSEIYYERCITMAQDPRSLNNDAHRDALAFLGLLHASHGDWDAALAMYAQAEALATSQHNIYELALIQFRRGDALRRSGDHAAAFSAYAQAIDNIEQLRSSFRDEDMKLGVLGTTQQMYEYMIVLCIEQNEYVNAVNYIERARARAFLDQLYEQNAPIIVETLEQQCVTAAEIQRELAADACIVEYFTVGVLPRGHSFLHVLAQRNPTLYGHFRKPPATYIAFITSDSLTVYHSPFDPSVLNRGHGGSQRLLQPRIAATLYAGLIAPFEPELERFALLYLVPHGVLHDVPFMALRSERGQWLVQQNHPAVAIVPSATVLMRYVVHQQSAADAPCFTFGFNGSGTYALELAEHEAVHVADLTNGKAWIGDAALPNLLHHGQHARWLHIASHGEYLMDEPLASFLALSDDQPLTAQAIMQDLTMTAELVVLSACVSGKAFIAIGDNPYGLQRAFLYAGARNVMCSLWEIRDVVALTFIHCFYAALLAGSSPAHALKHAMIHMRTMTLQQFRTLAETDHLPIRGFERFDTLYQADQPIFDDPNHWAGFILIGVG